MKASDFTYGKSFRIPYRGCAFDSLLELKFVLSIEDDYRFLRCPVKIGFDPKSMLTTNYFRDATKFYTPDFLVRHKLTNEAWLVELKPTEYKLSRNISIYNCIAGDYIRQHGLDWSFKVIFDYEIHLDPEKMKRFRVIAARKQSFQSTFDFSKMEQKYNQHPAQMFSSVPAFKENLSRTEYAYWVRRGT